MEITVKELIKTLQGFPDDSVISIADEDDEEFFIISFVPKNNVLNIVISDELEQKESAGK